ncbi:hypothetical protein [Pseudoflavonifractor sp. MSJ-37]|uniref:hypothetical protein n=1 Tax=Pseudoflavonifractor sp. MSJ-37 TaxID=2841531 RepID=UPI001C1229C8|nr:hypothetical protein [Pseudoflavonifractor sp. MSJ-37]MBU5435492.1 hypothetical protein [Pseudoflavonifractor sp. MSJ-37]
MSEVNADGVLLDPAEALLREAQHLGSGLMAERPGGLEDFQSRQEAVVSADGIPAGTVGGQHMPPNLEARHKGLTWPACRDRHRTR